MTSSKSQATKVKAPATPKPARATTGNSTTPSRAASAAATPKAVDLDGTVDPVTRFGQMRGWMRTGTGIFSSAIGLLAGTLTVVFLLVPTLKPDSPSEAFGATLSETKLETEVPLADYYTRIGQEPPESMSSRGLDQSGVLVSFTTTIDGFPGQECTLRWSVLDANTSSRVEEEWLIDQPGWPAGIFIPEAPSDQASGEVFVPNPPRAGSYFVRLELFDPNGTRLTSSDSPVFEVIATEASPPSGDLPPPP